MWYPRKEFKLERTLLRRETVYELVLKVIYTHGTVRGLEVAHQLRVPFPIIEGELVRLKQMGLCTVVGGAGIGGYEGMDYTLSRPGLDRAAEILAARPYIGPAPVDLAEYTVSVKEQKKDGLGISRDELHRQILADMVVNEAYLEQLGPALASGGPLLLHGAPGDGKTFLVEHLARFLGQGVFVPFAIEVDGQTIKLFDEKAHHEVSPEEEAAWAPYAEVRDKADSRWVFVHRPFVVMGGELELSMLDLTYQEVFKVYEAPFQLKANLGLLLIDDFGRQLISPRDFLNRWIYPLEKRIDHLSLVTGKKMQVPFETFLVFSTNLDAGELADEAFWRRIRYKVHVPSPTEAELRRIFEDRCRDAELQFDEGAFEHLLDSHYRGPGRALRACHGRDLVRQMVDFVEYLGLERKMSPELVDRAGATYFVNPGVKAG